MKNNNLFLILILLIISFFQNYCYAIYYESLGKTKYYASIAEPIFIIIPSQDMCKFKAYKNNINKEYIFTIKNNYNDGDNIRISEVDIKFYITIQKSKNNIPLQFRLYDCLSNSEIPLDESNKSEEIISPKNELFERQYKVVVYWDESIKLFENVDIEILINGAQYNYKYILKAFSISSNVSKKTNNNIIENKENTFDTNIPLIENEEIETNNQQIDSNNDSSIKYIIIKNKKMNN